MSVTAKHQSSQISNNEFNVFSLDVLFILIKLKCYDLHHCIFYIPHRRAWHEQAVNMHKDLFDLIIRSGSEGGLQTVR